VSNHTVRIELHDADEEDYGIAAALRRGFVSPPVLTTRVA